MRGPRLSRYARVEGSPMTSPLPGSAPSPPPRHRHSKWLWLAGTAIAALAAAGTAVAVASTGDGRTKSTAQPKSYCDATLRALHYTGDDPDRFHELLAPVQALAPREVASTIRTLRSSEPGSADFEAARGSWDYYNDNHCCQCLEGQDIPTIQEIEHPSR